jgi:membrane protein required for colicin V production
MFNLQRINLNFFTMEMNYIDIILLILLGYGFVKGIMNGFIIEIASIAALVIGAWGAIQFSDMVGVKLSEYLSWNETSISYAAFILTFIGIVIAVSFIAKAFTQIASVLMLGWLNKLLGAAFGVLKTAFILSIFLSIFVHINGKFRFVDEKDLQKSEVFNTVTPIAPSILPWFEDVDFDELWESANEKVEEVLN